MSHVRSQIRDAVRTALNTALGATVKRTRVYAIPSGTSITYSCYTNGTESTTQRTSSYQLRELPVVVDVLAIDDSDTLDDTLDDKCVLIEAALSKNKLGGLVKDLRLTKTELDFDGKGELPLGIARLTFTALYGTTETDPSTAI